MKGEKSNPLKKRRHVKPIMEYLAQFDGATGRHRRNHQDLLIMLYEHAAKRFGIKCNPMTELERPLVSTRPIRTLSLDQVRVLLKTPADLVEQVALDLLVGHGWRQVEIRRVKAGDVAAISGNLIEVEGKERRELTPILPQTADLLRQLAKELAPGTFIFRARRQRHGQREQLGEDGMRDLIKRLLKRAGLNLAGHDLRRTFATPVRKSSGDEYLAMRLLRDKIPGVGRRYIDLAPEQLVPELQKHSPLTHVARLATATKGDNSSMSIGGGNALPVMVKTEQIQAVIPPESEHISGGDGGDPFCTGNTKYVGIP